MRVTKEANVDLVNKTNEVRLDKGNGSILNYQRGTPKINVEIYLQDSMKGS
jgi:hypothetical protein